MTENNIHDELERYQSLWLSAMDRMPEIEPPDNQSEEGEQIQSLQILQERQEAASHQPLDIRDMVLIANDIDRFFTGKDKKSQEIQYTEEKDIGVIATKAAGSPNPQYITSIGKDQDVVVSPDFTDGEVLRDLNELKIKIEEMERKLHSSEILNKEKQENKLKKEVEDLRTKIEELSEKLTPHLIREPR